MTPRIKISSVLLFIISALVLLGCKPYKRQDLIMLYPNWAEGIALTHLAKLILEEKGYKVDLKRLEPGPIYGSIYRGDADICMDAWLPYTHKDYWKRYGNNIDILGHVFTNGITGLVVPTYVNINSIEELNANKDKFNGKIYGIAAGSGLHANTEKAIEEYYLDFSQIASSEASMMIALKDATGKKKWIAITGWKPHFMWTYYDLKPLKDPKGIFPTDTIKVISRKNFAKDKPELATFFKSFVLDEEILNILMINVSKFQNPETGAGLFYKKYKERLNFTEPSPKKER